MGLDPSTMISSQGGHVVNLFSHILCATDFSPSAERGLAIALKLAADLDAKLTLLHVDDSLWMTMGNLAPLPDMKKEGRKRIEEELRELRDRHELAPAQIEVLEGKAHELIAEKVASSGADLLVIGSHGSSGWERRHLGSVTEKLLHRVEVSILVVPPKTDPAGKVLRENVSERDLSFERLLLAVDLGATSEATVTDAVELARLYHSKLLVLHVTAPLEALFPGSGGFWSGSERSELEARLEQARAREMSSVVPATVKDEIAAELRIREGVAYEVIGSTARDEKVDLVILGANGRGKNERGWLGSTAHKVVRMGAGPSLIVK